MKRPKNSTLLGGLLFLLFFWVGPTRAERRTWSAERQLLFGLGSIAMVIGAVMLGNKLDERAQRVRSGAKPPEPSGDA